MSSRIVISDIHGCFNTFVALLDKLPAGVPITIAGDLVDRGPDSRKVIQLVKDRGYDCVLGNHEVMMMDELHFSEHTGKLTFNGYGGGIWQYNGGDACLNSYMYKEEEVLENGEKILVHKYNIKALKEHVEWFQTLPYYIEYKDVKDDKGQHLLVTHTTAADVWGIVNPESQSFKDAVTWDRISHPSKITGIFNIFGHSPYKNGPLVKEYFANVDGGAYLKREGYGKMYALMFPEMTIYEQENIG